MSASLQLLVADIIISDSRWLLLLPTVVGSWGGGLWRLWQQMLIMLIILQINCCLHGRCDHLLYYIDLLLRKPWSRWWPCWSRWISSILQNLFCLFECRWHNVFTGVTWLSMSWLFADSLFALWFWHHWWLCQGLSIISII